MNTLKKDRERFGRLSVEEYTAELLNGREPTIAELMQTTEGQIQLERAKWNPKRELNPKRENVPLWKQAIGRAKLNSKQENVPLWKQIMGRTKRTGQAKRKVRICPHCDATAYLEGSYAELCENGHTIDADATGP